MTSLNRLILMQAENRSSRLVLCPGGSLEINVRRVAPHSHRGLSVTPGRPGCTTNTRPDRLGPGVLNTAQCENILDYSCSSQSIAPPLWLRAFPSVWLVARRSSTEPSRSTSRDPTRWDLRSKCVCPRASRSRRTRCTNGWVTAAQVRNTSARFSSATSTAGAATSGSFQCWANTISIRTPGGNPLWAPDWHLDGCHARRTSANSAIRMERCSLSRSIIPDGDSPGV